MTGTSTPNPLAAVYARVSTDDQADHGASLPSQVAAAKALAEAEGYRVPDDLIYMESASGATLDRPLLTELRNHAAAGRISGAFYYSPDRFSRDPVDLVVMHRELERAGVHVGSVMHPPSSDPMGQAMQFLAGTFGAVERKMIMERTRRGKVAMAQAGTIPSGYGRYGGPAGMVYNSQTRKLDWRSEEWKVTIQRILRAGVRGFSTRSIAKILNAEGVPATSGGPWHASAVGKVLKNAKLYAGRASWAGIPLEGAVTDPAIAMEEADAIQHRLGRNKALSTGYGRRHWLTGRVRGLCGRRYSISVSGCRCDGRNAPVRCDCPPVGLKKLEEGVWAAMSHLFNNPKADYAALEESRSRIREARAGIEAHTKSLQAETDVLAQRARNLLVQHEQGWIDDGELADRMRTIRDREVEVREELDGAGSQQQALAAGILNGLHVMDIVDPQELLLGEDWTTMSAEKMVEMLGVEALVNAGGSLSVRMGIPAAALMDFPEGRSRKLVAPGVEVTTSH